MAEPLSLQRRLVTPEGVDLRLKLGEAGQRAAAFLIDCAILLTVLVVVTIGLGALLVSLGLRSAQPISILWLLGFFLLRNGWFLLFELGPRAATPGKRILRLRVVARDGGRLTADAVIARNAMRELEFFLPLSFLAQRSASGGADGGVTLLGIAWTAVFVLFPLFNRDRLRVGDLLAGTWVIRLPKQTLGLDLVDDAEQVAGRYAFTDAQLGVYGEFELQRLEEVLRVRDRETMGNVAETIRGKIGWPGHPDDAEFLGAYYVALRARLERGMLLGRRRKDKHDVA